MRILIVTDAWFPQVNGVVRTLHTLGKELTKLGHEVTYITPNNFKGFPCPSYPEIKLSLVTAKSLGKTIEKFGPDTVHISTEGPLGLAARGYCIRKNMSFTTAYHTRFPEYVYARWRVPLSWGYAFLRWFHKPSKRIMTATPTIDAVLSRWRFGDTARWSRGVDTELFKPRNAKKIRNGPRALYVGRVAVEKNVEAFLSMPFDGTKTVVGDGPQLVALKRRYPEVQFTGAKKGQELADLYSSADVFVFPSRTDTFGLVLLEALASGVPVAAYPVAGPLDVIGESGAGVLDEDLALAAKKALDIPRGFCRDYALQFSWENCAKQFIGNLEPITP